MNKNNALIALFIISIVAALWSYKKPKLSRPNESDWALKIGNHPISALDFKSEWERLTKLRQKQTSQKEVIDQLYQEWLGYEAARSSGFLESEAIQREIRRLVGSAYKKELIRRQREEAGDTNLSEASLKAEFESQIAEWTRPAKFLVGWLTCSVPEKGTDVKRMENLNKILGWREAVVSHTQPRQKFAELCRLYSEDPTTRYFSGELGWKSEDQLRNELGDKVVDSILKLNEVGELTEVIEFPGSAAFFQLRGYSASQVRPFAEVQPALRDRRIRENESKIEGAVKKDLESRVMLQTNSKLLEQLQAPEFISPESQAPAPMASF
jgi:hypothetical protein